MIHVLALIIHKMYPLLHAKITYILCCFVECVFDLIDTVHVPFFLLFVLLISLVTAITLLCVPDFFFAGHNLGHTSSVR